MYCLHVIPFILPVSYQMICVNCNAQFQTRDYAGRDVLHTQWLTRNARSRSSVWAKRTTLLRMRPPRCCSVVIITFELGYLLAQGQQHTGRLSLRGIVLYKAPLPVWQYAVLVPLVLAWAILASGLLAPRSGADDFRYGTTSRITRPTVRPSASRRLRTAASRSAMSAIRRDRLVAE
jgi:hypothetical protein